MAPQLIPGADLLWDGFGQGNRWQNNTFGTLIVAEVAKELGVERSLGEILQILSLTLFLHFPRSRIPRQRF